MTDGSVQPQPGVALVRTAAELAARARESGTPDAGPGPGTGTGTGTGTGPSGAPGGRRPRATVMTMGALHEGHAALIRAARERVGPYGEVVVTVFVNPLQFGPSEDLDRYPRTLDADLRIAERAGADVVFAPSADEVYPGGEPQVRVAAGPMGERFEGAVRPGHFDGVLTVVAKFLHLTAPDLACFGEKDAQQLALVRRMVGDLNLPVEIVAVPTVREPDGLALSSRNRYLSPGERRTALALPRALCAAGRERAPREALAAARSVLDEAAHADPPLAVDYLSLIDPRDFTEFDPARDAEREPARAPGAGPEGGGPRAGTDGLLLAVAGRVGTTRLIDNVRLHGADPHGARDSSAAATPAAHGPVGDSR